MPSFSDVLQARLSRRSLLTSGLSAAGLGWLGPAAWAERPARLHRRARVDGRHAGGPARLRRGGPLRLGRSDLGWPRVQAGREQQRGRSAPPGRHAPRRHALLPAARRPDRLDPRAARHQPRVHGRRPAPPGRHADVDRREGAEVAGGARDLGDRGADGRRPLARDPAVALRAPGHRGDPDGDHRAGRRTRVDADRRRSGRPHRARHDEQLRDGLHAVGDLSHLRGELPVLLRQPLRPRARAPAALRHHRAGRRVPLARVRRALRCRAPSERAESLRLGRRDRSVRSVAAAREAHRDGPLQARGRRPVDGAGSAAWPSTWATTSASSTSTSS